MNPFANHLSDRADRAWFIIWLIVFIASGTFITWFGVVHGPSGHDAAASTKPHCVHNTVTVMHNQPTPCDLIHGGILIEFDTSRRECLHQGGRFVVVIDRNLCVGEDI